MSKRVEDSKSSTSQSDDEEKPETEDGSLKPMDENRETRGPGPKKRLAGSPGETSTGNVLQPSHLKDYTDQGHPSPSKRTCSDRPKLVRGKAINLECNCGEDSNHALTCPMKDLELKDESVGEANEQQPPGVAELEQSPKMSCLSVPVHSSEAHPTSPKEKGLYGRAKEFGNTLGNFFSKLSPKKSPKKGSSSAKADLKSKQKPLKANPPKLNPAKSEASSSSSSPKSKRGDSSPDRSQPSTSSSDPNVEYRRAAKKSLHKLKSRAESSSASTSDDSRRVETLNVPSGSGGHRSGQSSRSPSPGTRARIFELCTCPNRHSAYDGHDSGCPARAVLQRRARNRNAKNSPPYRYMGNSSSTASDSNVEYSPATKSPSKSKKTVSPRVSTRDPSQPGTSQWLYVPPSDANRSDDGARSPNRRSPGNSPNRSDDGARSPNRRSPSRSPSTSRARSQRRPNPS